MKKGLFVFGFISLVVLCAIIWVGVNSRKHTEMAPGISETQTDTSLAPTKTRPGKSGSPLAPIRLSPNMASTTNFQMAEEIQQNYKDTLDATKWEWRMPIEFYGKVLDEQERPVQGAEIDFMWNDLSETGTSKAQTMTDENGLFSLTGVTGKGLSVYVGKEGYYVVKRATTSFDYSSGYHPYSSQPERFYLRKKGVGVDLITSQRGVRPAFDFSEPRDGTAIKVDFINRKAGGDGDMEVSSIKPARGQTATEWSFRMSIPDGGFIEQNAEFPFEAPESGYQPTIEFHFKSGETNWTDEIIKKYYIALGQPRKYGRIEIQTGMYEGVRLKYAINPDGSRNLESK